MKSEHPTPHFSDLSMQNLPRIARLVAVSAALASGWIGHGAAFAATPLYYASANLVDENTDPFSPLESVAVDATNHAGGTFQVVGQDELVSSIGAYFSQYSSGTVFGAIVSASAVTGLPTAGSLATLSLASVVFDASNGGDLSASFAAPVDLAPGLYSVVFGSGQFGARGNGALVASQDPIGAPSLVQSLNAGRTWSPLDTAVRFTVMAAPVPEVSGWLMGTLGLLGLVGLARAHRQRRE